MAVYRCESCGSPLNVEEGQKYVTCEFCGAKQSIYDFQLINNINDSSTIHSSNTVSSIISNALDLIKKQQWTRASETLDSLLNVCIDGDVYLYKSIALLHGKRPFLSPLGTIKDIIKNLETASEIEDKAVYHLLLWYIKLDYYNKKFLRISPSSDEELAKAKELGGNDKTVVYLEELLGTRLPKINK